MEQNLILLILSGLLVAYGSVGDDQFLGVWAEGTAECSDTYMTIEKNGSVYAVSFLTEGKQEKKELARLDGEMLYIVGALTAIAANDNGTELSVYFLGKEVVYQRTTPEQQDACDYAHAGLAAFKAEEFDEAIFQYKQALVLKPDDLETVYSLGAAYHNKARASDDPPDVSLLEKAIAQFEQVIEMDPTYQAAYVGLGISYAEMAEYDLAISLYKQALALSPDDVKTMANLGRAYVRLEEYDNGVEIFKKIVQLTPDDTEARSVLAWCYVQKDHFDKAIEQHQLILEEQPEYFESLQNLAVLYQQTEQWQLALEMAQKAMAMADAEDRSQWEAFVDMIEAELAED